MISCDHCKMVFKYNCHLEKHLSRKFPCFTNIPTELSMNSNLEKDNIDNENDTSRENMITKKCDIVNEKIENDNQKHHCDACLKTFCRKDALDRHVGNGCKLLKDDVRILELKLNKDVLLPSDNMSCRFCKQVFLKGKYLKPHYETCKKRKEYLSELKTELKELEDKDVECEKCGKHLSSISYKKKHEEKCNGLDSLQCPTCHKWFSSASTKSEHRRNVMCTPPPIDERKIHSCEKCNKQLSSKRNLERHMDKCNGLHSLQCPICHKWFSCASSKSEHRRNVICSPPQTIEQSKKPKRQNFSQSMRLKIACEQDWKCGICTEKLPSTFQVDHIIPVFRGGDNSRENGMALCVSCHATKTQNENIERHK